MGGFSPPGDLKCLFGALNSFHGPKCDDGQFCLVDAALGLDHLHVLSPSVLDLLMIPRLLKINNILFLFDFLS